MGEFFASLYAFKGRLGRLGFIGRYIFIYVLIILGSFLAGFASGLLATISPVLGIVGIIVTTIFIVSISVIPPIAITARRLHDIGLSGWWQLLPIVFLLAAIVAMAMNLGGSVSNLQNTDFDNLTSLDVLTGALGGPAMIAFGLMSLFGLMLIFWPGTKGPNKYDHHSNANYSGYKDATSSHNSATQQFLINFVEQIPEDSMYLFKHLKDNTPGMLKISLPEDRLSASVQIANASGLNQKKVKKLFAELGFQIKSVFKES